MYSELFELQADILKALAHSRRLEIIHLLRDQELPVNDIHRMLDLPQANISQHLTILRDAGIVQTRREGKNIFYAVGDQKYVLASDLIREVLIDQADDLQLAKAMKLEMKQLVPLVHDPVCGMRLSPKTASFSHKHQQQTYYFCASGCLKQFTQQPEVYVETKSP